MKWVEAKKQRHKHSGLPDDSSGCVSSFPGSINETEVNEKLQVHFT